MRLHIVSDLHLEFLHDYGRSLTQDIITDADVLIVAGDLAPFVLYSAIEDFFVTMCSKYKHVIYVLGNHEYYKSSTTEVLKDVEALRGAASNLHVFTTGGFIELDGQRFVCGTMWFPDQPNNVLYEKQMSDFRVIKQFNPWVYGQNASFRSYLDTMLMPGDVVVTHHLPCFMSVDKRYKNDSLNRFFLSEEGNRIADKEPKIWIHGHTHISCDYLIHNTRVVANPHGYPHEIGPTFNKHLVIEV